ncbi:GtrA family protein [Methylobacterium oryzihabitans]|uniref:GtrA family protein n=1 Tax=Methylobacterium oryzihabitans TaxID=2499852 RepID=A0A437NWN5_9HYPH|nr:GtrA family protein [Methylobacterium oryzihabitans]
MGIERVTGSPILSRREGLTALGRQFVVYVAVSLVALAVHYGLLVLLVEALAVDPVPSAMTGYVAGGVASYGLNRRLTYASERPHAEAGWRFAVVATVGLGLTWGVMRGLTRGAGLAYLPAQLLTTGLVLFWNFAGHRLWTFAQPRPVP